MPSNFNASIDLPCGRKRPDGHRSPLEHCSKALLCSAVSICHERTKCSAFALAALRALTRTAPRPDRLS